MKFHFSLKDEHLNNLSYASEIKSIEGTIQIYINGALFYEDMCANIYELATQLAQWLQKIESGQVIDFVYNELPLQFHVQAESVRVYTLYEHQSSELLPIETVKRAVLDYCIKLYIALVRIGYKSRLAHQLKQLVSENKWALILFESNQYDEAFSMLEKLANEKPSVESLNNYAYLLLHEEEDYGRAWDVLQQVLPLHPQVDFPYLMLGELAIYFKRFKEAEMYLQKALQFRKSEVALHNLGISRYFLGEYEQAAQAFSCCAGDSGTVQLYEVVSWIRAGKPEKAKSLLNAWNEKSDDYTGAMEIADVYAELRCYEEAHTHFTREWKEYYLQPYIISRYAYTLWQLGDMEACQQIIQKAIVDKKEEIVDEQQSELDEHWSESDRAERLIELQLELNELHSLTERLAHGYVPDFQFELFSTSGCQLFECILHGHPEYDERVK